MMTQGFSAGKRINFSVVKIVKIEINHMNGVLSSLPFIKTPMNEYNVTDHAGNVMLQIISPMELGPCMSESVKYVKVGIVELFYFCFLEINAADEDQQVFVEVGRVVH